jgi:tryptophanyl-tRNA synthetase
MVAFISPFRNRIEEVLKNEELLNRAMKTGQEKAKASASVTVREVREVIGIRY